jgi:serine/threonine protein kinase
VAEFRQTVVELGIMDAAAFDRTAAGFVSDLEGLTRSLSRSGLITPYQAAAICQGKTRGLVVGDYLILDKLGQGGMGVVFKARHRRHGVTVALKILPPRLSRDRKLVLRFRREIHAAALLVHPNIVAALDADEDRGIHFLTMEYIEGIDLDGFVKNGGALSVAQAVDYVMQAARGLAAAHARGIIHRDIKPGNLMLDAFGTIRVLDLGLALLKEEAAQSAQTAAMTLTRVGTYMGTVDFMAPEQAQNSHTVDHRADIYSMACSLHFLLTVRPPFEGTTPLSRLIAHQHAPAPSLHDKRADVPDALDAIVHAMMAKRPEDRPSSMTEVLARLEACRSPAAGASLAAPGLLTLPGPVRTALVPSTPSGPSGANSHGDPGVAEIPASNLGGSAREDGVVEAAEVPPPSGASLPGQPDHAGAKTWRPLALLTALAALAAITAIITLNAINRRDRDARPVDDRPETGLAIHAPIEPGEQQSLAANGSDPESAGNESERATDSVMPAPTTKDQRDGRQMVASTTGRKAPGKDVVPTRDKKPEPSQKPMPSIAPTVSVPTFDGTPCFLGHNGAAVRTIAISSNGKLALSADASRYIRLWNIKTGVEMSGARHPSQVYDAGLSWDGRFAFTSTKGVFPKNGAVRLWNMTMSPPKAEFTSTRWHEGHINAVTVFPDGRALSGGDDGRVVLWNLNVRRPVGVLGRQKGAIHAHAAAFFPRGGRAATGGEDRLVHIWNLKLGKEVATLAGSGAAITSIAISADGHRLATGSADGTVILWDPDTRSQIRSFAMPGGEKNARVAILPGGNVLAAGNAVGHLILWDADTGLVLRQAKGPLVKHGDLAVLPDGERILTADQDGVVRLWVPRR